MEEKIICKNSKRNSILISDCFPQLVLENILKIQEDRETVYLFEKGQKASFLYDRSCVNDLSFNPLQVYDKNIFDAFQIIKTMWGKMCVLNNLDVNKNRYYITSEINNISSSNFWYDDGGIRIPVFSGHWILECQDNPSININNEDVQLQRGSIVMFEAGKKYSFSNISVILSFNISTYSKIVNQYPQKWMPL